MNADLDLRQRTAAALDTIMKCRKAKSDREVAARTSKLSRETLHQRRHGKTPLSVDDIAQLSEALNVPHELFFRSEIEIYAWFAAHANEPQWAARDSNPEPADTTRGETYLTFGVRRCAA